MILEEMFPIMKDIIILYLPCVANKRVHNVY